MDPNQQPIPAPQPEQPMPAPAGPAPLPETPPAAVPAPEVPAAAPVAPVAPVDPAAATQPAMPAAPAAMPGQIPEAAAKKIKATSTTAIILGVLMILIGIVIAILLDVTGALNCIFGVLYLVFGIKLRSSNASVATIVTAFRVLSFTVAINIIVSLLSGNGAGVLPILVLYFASVATKHMFEAGLITTKVMFTTKPTTPNAV
jgi:hypothetical protein